MRSIKDFKLSESRRVVRGGREISPTGLGVPSRKRIYRSVADGLTYFYACVGGGGRYRYQS
ncbi:hypothetical protein IMSAG185_01193 [Lachnospiraceae bacterium]|nr:hypothetical protein IMSAG185_01193 [Lachnospiraceae bacterium]